MNTIGKTGFQANKPATQAVPLPQAGDDCCCRVRMLTAKDVEDLRAFGGKAELDVLYEVLARSVCDDAGALLFASADEAKGAFGLPFADLKAIVDRVMEFSGMAGGEKNSPQQSGTPTRSAGT